MPAMSQLTASRSNRISVRLCHMSSRLAAAGPSSSSSLASVFSDSESRSVSTLPSSSVYGVVEAGSPGPFSRLRWRRPIGRASLRRALVGLPAGAVDLEPDAAFALALHAPAVGQLVHQEEAPAGVRACVENGVLRLEPRPVVGHLDSHDLAADVHVQPDRILAAHARVL